ncbi:SDR family NAD(P)-dependent oxidoreductase [Novosphingobium taihuense]|uniref:NAD(P)-dependent dehydrogenase (Short-subunit alcohol dehydrogenase family) n=1 Tax=Novosphingobium taihuense TaxID=260085 RepID=A0A7W7AC01_9SPHN|nr:SDR family oxidoreductase [Novosphingobium taihuense]MBB4614229.1 NAD(P)-dependent dehydrogenase (short-subunit alcohol dehydrogenase family) [Novosphingobium taihuense]TWH87076.1 NAD(P)-dependent dehydrogenase (short-subunit alcohol dehydrogenase family) [Novosphingobium taihuense]
MKRLSNKVAIITGGGQGVGLGIAQAFADEGASIVLTGRTPDKLAAVVPDLEARGAKVAIHPADARSRADANKVVEFTVETFGGIDILVNNAQSTIPGLSFKDYGDEEIASTVESGLYGTIYHMQAVWPHMAKRGGGSIINFGSRQGIVAPAGYSVYGATKEAIRGLSRVAAREMGPDGIRVNVINPSAMSPAALKWLSDFPEEAASNLLEVSLRRWGDANKDIGPVAVFLATDESQYVSGQTINVDGGMVML